MSCTATFNLLSAGIDLAEIAGSNTPVTAVPGGSFSVTDTVHSQGSLAAGIATKRYYLSLEALAKVLQRPFCHSELVEEF